MLRLFSFLWYILAIVNVLNTKWEMNVMALIIIKTIPSKGRFSCYHQLSTIFDCVATILPLPYIFAQITASIFDVIVTELVTMRMSQSSDIWYQQGVLSDVTSCRFCEKSSVRLSQWKNISIKWCVSVNKTNQVQYAPHENLIYLFSLSPRHCNIRNSGTL